MVSKLQLILMSEERFDRHDQIYFGNITPKTISTAYALYQLHDSETHLK